MDKVDNEIPENVLYRQYCVTFLRIFVRKLEYTWKEVGIGLHVHSTKLTC